MRLPQSDDASVTMWRKTSGQGTIPYFLGRQPHTCGAKQNPTISSRLLRKTPPKVNRNLSFAFRVRQWFRNTTSSLCLWLGSYPNVSQNWSSRSRAQQQFLCRSGMRSRSSSYEDFFLSTASGNESRRGNLQRIY